MTLNLLVYPAPAPAAWSLLSSHSGSGAPPSPTSAPTLAEAGAEPAEPAVERRRRSERYRLLALVSNARGARCAMGSGEGKEPVRVPDEGRGRRKSNDGSRASDQRVHFSTPPCSERADMSLKSECRREDSRPWWPPEELPCLSSPWHPGPRPSRYALGVHAQALSILRTFLATSLRSQLPIPVGSRSRSCAPIHKLLTSVPSSGAA